MLHLKCESTKKDQPRHAHVPLTLENWLYKTGDTPGARMLYLKCEGGVADLYNTVY